MLNKSIFKVYCAHPISGLSFLEVMRYYKNVQKKLIKLGYFVLHPMTGKNILRTEKKFKAEGYGNPISNNHSITERDRWMVTQSDIVYINLFGAREVSIGCVAELAWGHHLGKHTIVVMEKDNIHRHCFILEMADIIFETEKEADNYFKKLIVMEK